MRVLSVAAVAVALLVAILAANTARLEPAPKAPPADRLAVIDAAEAAARLAGALAIPTVTHSERERVDWSQWDRLTDYLAQAFPRVHASLSLETVDEHALLYTWDGRAPSRAPILLLGHTDVVPVPEDTLAEWTHPPFAGTVADGFVWGRGAIDDKSGVLAILEAVEHLLAEGFAPARTLILAFGHDEEIGGERGAAGLAARLAARGVQADWALDEGGIVTRGIFRGIDAPVATIPTGEKGYLSLELSAGGTPGHSSMPPDWTAAARVARAVARLASKPFAPRLTPNVAAMLERIAPHMGLATRVAVANRWLLEGVLLDRLDAAGGAVRSMVRTTTAPTVLRAGDKDNILPRRASAIVNFRLLPGDTRDTVTARVVRVIDDPHVRVLPLAFGSDPSGPPDGDRAEGFALLERTVNEVFPAAVVAPGLVVGATDLRHYDAVARHRYNFSPVTLGPDDLPRIHGNDERVSVEDYARMIQFYDRMLRNAAG